MINASYPDHHNLSAYQKAKGSNLDKEYWLEIIQESYNLDLSDIISLNVE